MADKALGQDIKALLGDLETTSFSACSVEAGPASLYLRRPMQSAPAPVAAPLEEGSTAEAPEKTPQDPRTLLRSPRVGHFFPKPGSASGEKFRKGDPIRAGEVYGTIEAMHLKYELRADVAGAFDEFLAAEGEAVEYGQPLLALAAD